MRLIVCPLAQVEAGLAQAPSHVLSLVSPGMALPAFPDHGAGRSLVLRFHDIPEPAEGLRAVGLEDIAALLGFAASWPGNAPLLIHCWAGISRSPAAAYILACRHSPPGQEQALARRLRQAAPQATPNPRMIALADAILSRSGRMVRAIAELGRGSEAGSGELFTLDLTG